MHPEEVREVVEEKRYHSNEVVLGLGDIEVRTYIAEPIRKEQNWTGKEPRKPPSTASALITAGSAVEGSNVGSYKNGQTSVTR